MTDAEIARLKEALLPEFVEALVPALTQEMMKLHLGDDYRLPEQEAADLLHISKATLARKRGAKEIPCSYEGRSPRYSMGVLRAYLKEAGTKRRRGVALHLR